MTSADIESSDQFHRFVLLGVIDLRARDDVPVHSFDVTGVCEDLLDDFEDLQEMFPGGVTRKRVISALNQLESDGHLAMETKRSATGKGRPAYDVAVDDEAVLAELNADDRFAAAVERVREHRA